MELLFCTHTGFQPTCVRHRAKKEQKKGISALTAGGVKYRVISLSVPLSFSELTTKNELVITKTLHNNNNIYMYMYINVTPQHT